MQSSTKRVAVIGGGISGLAAAHRLCELDSSVELRLLEAGQGLGGSLKTLHEDGFLVERGADNFITTIPWGVDLCRRIGFEDQLIETTPDHRTAFVVRRGRLHKIPEGFVIMAPSRIWPVVTTPILSPLGKLRMVWEYLVPKRTEDQDESLAAFVVRRFGRETYERLVQPLVGGIYTGDPEKLSVRTTMPRFVDMERDHGSLIRAVFRQARKRRQQSQGGGARYSMFVAPRVGISSLVDAIAGRLPTGCVQLDAAVSRIEMRPDGRWSVWMEDESADEQLYDAVVLATPAASAARLVGPLDSQLADLLDNIPHASCSIVSLAYRRDEIRHPMDGFGFVVPSIENRKVLSASFSSVKYEGRAPDGQVLVRVFIGGACQQELAELPDDQLESVATEELAELLKIEGTPNRTWVTRQPRAMPQYYVGHGDRVAQIEAGVSRLPGLFVAGNAYSGVGIPYCIHNAEQAAQRVVEFLNAREPSGE